MGKMKELHQLESDLFQVVTDLHEHMTLKRKEEYKVCLVVMDQLNEEYNELTGNYYIHPLKALTYYENLWRKFE